MNRFLSAISLGVMLFTVAIAQDSGDSIGTPTTLQQLRADIRYLASDELKGRSATEDSIDVAAEYIALRMADIGLDMTLFDGTPMQEFEIPTGPRPGGAENNHIEFKLEGQETPISASLADGFNPLAIGTREATVKGPVVFAGYGITAPKLGYDDYEGIDSDGATVIILRKEPGVNDPNSPFDGTKNSRHAFFQTKVDNAFRHGAAALIIVNDPSSVLTDVQDVRSKISRERERIQSTEKQIQALPKEAANSRKRLEDRIANINKMIVSMMGELEQAQSGLLEVGAAGIRPFRKTLPTASIGRDVLDQLLMAASGQTLEDIESKIDASYAPQSLDLAKARVDLHVEMKPAAAKTSNVIGLLAGRGDLAEETIVVGGHYDHVGMGRFGSLAPGTLAVHNGADDNASGTATMLAVAKKVTERLADEPSHRRFLFMAFTGEERGLLGSKHYARYPRFPLNTTVAMLNMDMVGRLRDNELTVYGTGSAPSFDALLEEVNQAAQFNLFKEASGYGPSDHQSFYEKNVPVLFFFTGLHNDYHRPTDDFDKIDFGGMVRITDMVSDVALKLGIRKERPKYAETEKGAKIRRQVTAYLGVNLSDRDDHVVLSGLAPDGPAERAGLQVGDRLEKLGKNRVRTAAEVLVQMRARSPGEQLNVQVRRDGQTIDVTAQLQARP